MNTQTFTPVPGQTYWLTDGTQIFCTLDENGRMQFINLKTDMVVATNSDIPMARLPQKRPEVKFESCLHVLGFRASTTSGNPRAFGRVRCYRHDVPVIPNYIRFVIERSDDGTPRQVV